MYNIKIKGKTKYIILVQSPLGILTFVLILQMSYKFEQNVVRKHEQKNYIPLSTHITIKC